MDFSFSEEQDALRELAAQIFTGMATTERVVEVERTDDRFDRELWAELAKANLLGIALPESVGGLGFGMIELCLLFEQQGRRVAPVPLLPTLAYAAPAVARFGTDAQQQSLLGGVNRGETVLTAAWAQPASNNVLRSSVTATRTGDGWTLSGVKVAVPWFHVADAVLVPAETAEGLTVFVVPAGAVGVSADRNVTTNREIHSTVTFDDVAVGADAVLGRVGHGAEVVRYAIDRVNLANAATVLGCCEEALAMTAAYTSQHEQFGRPLSTNQGVALRAADAYIDTDGIRVTLWSAAWRLDAGLPCADEILVAKYWAAEAGDRVVHATQHLHGGMGADVDYAVHRYFIWVKQYENLFGGGTQQLARLGESIAQHAKAAAGVA